MKASIISGDIISYTSLNNKEKLKIEQKLKHLLTLFKKDYNVFGRIIKGDYLEFYIPETEKVLRYALIIKCYIRFIAFEIQSKTKTKQNRLKLFQTYGIRLAIGIGELERLDLKKGIIDGEAIYMSGRLINSLKTYDKERAVVKNTLFIKTYDKELNDETEALISLLDKVISDTTAKQAEVLFYKLRGFSETEISKRLKVSQSAVNQHSTGAGWNAIEKAVLRFEEVIKAKIK